MRADAIISVGCPPPLAAKCVSKPFSDQDQVQIVFFVLFFLSNLFYYGFMQCTLDLTLQLRYLTL